MLLLVDAEKAEASEYRALFFVSVISLFHGPLHRDAKMSMPVGRVYAIAVVHGQFSTDKTKKQSPTK